MRAFIESIGVQAPGLNGWEAAQQVLSGQQDYNHSDLPPYSPSFLPANERRRTTATIKMALRTAEDVHNSWPRSEACKAIPTLFACVDGDTEISAKMTSAILVDEPMVSPIHFHNSVHNAPAGYWMIGQENQAPSSSISVGEYQIANTFLEALTQLSEASPYLMLVLYDLPIDPIIESFQPEIEPFGAGFILSLEQTKNSLAQLDLSLSSVKADMVDTKWFGSNIAAQVLPILSSLANKIDAAYYYPLSAKLSAAIAIKSL